MTFFKMNIKMNIKMNNKIYLKINIKESNTNFIVNGLSD